MISPYTKQTTIVWLTIFLVGCGNTSDYPIIDTITVEVTGEEFNWHFRYPGEDGLLDTDDDKFSVQDLYLPDNTKVRLDLKSKDYIYNLAIPKIKKKEIAVPDLNFNMQFETSGENTWALLGDQFCGYSHETLIGKVFVRDQSKDHFYSW